MKETRKNEQTTKTKLFDTRSMNIKLTQCRWHLNCRYDRKQSEWTKR